MQILVLGKTNYSESQLLTQLVGVIENKEMNIYLNIYLLMLRLHLKTIKKNKNFFYFF